MVRRPGDKCGDKYEGRPETNQPVSAWLWISWAFIPLQLVLLPDAMTILMDGAKICRACHGYRAQGYLPITEPPTSTEVHTRHRSDAESHFGRRKVAVMVPCHSATAAVTLTRYPAGGGVCSVLFRENWRFSVSAILLESTKYN